MQSKQPRPYQLRALNAIDAALARGVRRPVIAQATGLGKTFLAANLIKRRIERVTDRALFLAPIDEVVFQNAKAVQAENPGLPVGIVKAALNQKHAPIVIASLHTVRKKARLAQLPKQGFSTVIVDECHLNLDAYREVIDHVAAPDALVCGLSATPYRLDGRGLDEVFEELLEDAEMSLIDGIRDGWLCEPVSLQFSLKGADFSGVHFRKGDLDQNEVAEFIQRAANWQEKIVEEWRKHAGGMKTAMFVPKVEMAYQLADYLRSIGIRAAAVDGKTEKAVRRNILAQYEAGQLQVIVNVACLNTGWDSPTTECLLIATLTASKARYLQTLGRGTRLLPGTIDGLHTAEERLAAIAASRKPNFLVMDLVGVTKRHKLFNLATLAGAEKPAKNKESLTELIEQGEDEKAAEEREAKARERAEEEERQRMEAEFEARRVRLIEWQNKPAEKKRQPEFYWQHSIDHARTLHVSDRVITVRPMADENWIATDRKSFRAICATAEECQAKAEAFARTLFFGGQNAAWRSKPASEKQINLMTKLRIRFAPGISAGEASELIDARFKKAKVAA